MPDVPELTTEMLALLVRLSKIQDSLKPLQKRMSNLTFERVTVMQSLRDLGLAPKDIHQLSKVPLSTIYANTTRKTNREGGREGDG